jgi:hypothetical protein
VYEEGMRSGGGVVAEWRRSRGTVVVVVVSVY